MRALLALVLFLLAAPAFAQEQTPEEERGVFLAFIEDRLSGPNRQIRIQGIDGVLSSDATIGLITVADNQGVWLRIVNARIVWSRSTLILQQRLQIDRLAADRIEILRRPVPDESLPAPEATSWRVPELPIAINLDALDVPLIAFGPGVFGLESQVAVTGRLTLDGGSLDTALDITRLDGPGGHFTLAATYANATEQLDLDLRLSEPENGIVANLLNIEGRPPVDLTVAGSGQLSELDVTLALDADGARVLSGKAQLRRQADGMAWTAELAGPIARLVPARFRSFFGADTQLTANGLSMTGGGIRLDDLALRSAALAIEASAQTAPDGFLTHLRLDATIDNGADDPVVLPLPGGRTTVDRAEMRLSFGETGSEEWSGSIVIDELSTPGLDVARTVLDLGGLARNLDRPDARSITFAIDGALSGIVATRDDVAEALGEEIVLDVDGAWDAGGPVRLSNALLSGNGLSVSLAGDIADLAFDGDISVVAESIAPFSGLAGRDIAGALDLAARGELRPLTGAFDLVVDSASDDLRIGIAAADNLLAGRSTITGRVARGETGLTVETLRVGNDRVELTADGTFATGTADFDYALTLADLALLTPYAQGRLEARGRASGTDGTIALTTAAGVRSGMLAGARLTDARLGFDGTLAEGILNGTIGGDAFLDGERAQLSAGIGAGGGEWRLTDLDFSAGAATLTGALARNAAGLIDGSLALDATDVSTAAALFLTKASGAAQGTIALSHAEGRQNLDVAGTARDLIVGEMRLGRMEGRAVIGDLFNVPVIDGTVEAEAAVLRGIEIANLNATAHSSGDTTSFEGTATLENGAEARARGTLSPEGEGWRLALDEASFGRGLATARLVEPASILVEGDTVTVDSLTLDVGGGRVHARGTAGETLDVSVAVTRLPLSIANLVQPELDLGGTVDGTARITGSRDAPDARFDVTGNAITAAPLRRAGQSALALRATGNTTGRRLNVDASVSSPEGMRVLARGGLPLGDGQIALDVELAAFPLATLNQAVPGQDLAGTVTGSARVGGTFAAPQVDFNLRGAGIAAAPLRAAGAAPLEATAAGRFAGGTVTLSSATVAGPRGLALTASGTLPLSGPGMSITLNGSAPLSLANGFLATRGTQFAGTLEFNGTVSGSLQQPALRGMFSTTGAQAVDPITNLRMSSINIMGTIDGETVTLRSANAALASGGSVSASGTVSINAAAGFPANLRIVLDRARYADGTLLVATMSGTLALTGPLTRDPLLSGEIEVERAEIAVPESFGGPAMIDVVHRNPPPAVVETLRRAGADDGTPSPTARPSVMRLDLGINAPARIFVRGRGLDAEMGGRVRLTGPVTGIQPVGAFEMIRGRLTILSRRITFDEGRVTLVGDLDPYLDFIARTQSPGITAFVTVRGRVSALDISFSSQPQLPQDEVLARLIFNRGMHELSAFQIAQLAAAAAELAGGSNTSLMGNLRDATGLDDLDIVTDSQGNAALRAGRYINDNVYLGVEASSRGTRGTINLDITENLKARGSLGTDGDSSLGVFFERDY